MNLCTSWATKSAKRSHNQCVFHTLAELHTPHWLHITVTVEWQARLYWGLILTRVEISARPHYWHTTIHGFTSTVTRWYSVCFLSDSCSCSYFVLTRPAVKADVHWLATAFNSIPVSTNSAGTWGKGSFYCFIQHDKWTELYQMH